MADGIEQIFQFLFQHPMIIFSIGIFSHLRCFGVLVYLSRKIIVGQANDRFGTGDQFGGINTFFEVIGHPLHGALITLVQPLLQVLRFLIQPFSPGNTYQQKAGFLGK